MTSKFKRYLLTFLTDKLNRLLLLDHNLTKSIISTRFPVNEEYASSEFIFIENDSNEKVAGILGILNGIVNHSSIRMAASYSDESETTLTRFVLLKKKEDSWERIY